MKRYFFFLTLGVLVTNAVIFIAIYFKTPEIEASVSGYKLTPILFVPSGSTEKSQYLTSINSSMAEIQNWYATQVGTTFRYDPAVKIVSSHPSSYFTCTSGPTCLFPGGAASGIGTDYGLVLADLNSLVGPSSAQIDRIVFMVGAGGLSVGGGALDNYRFALMGDGVLDGISGLLTPSDIGSSKGAIAHEIGHTFDLIHPDANVPEYNNLMGLGFQNFPNVVINDTITDPELNYLKKSPFLLKQSVPGCTAFTGTHLSVTQNTVLCPGVYRVGGSGSGVISIDADNVTLDASNASFLGNNTTSGNYGVVVNGHNNVTIKNIRLSGYFVGLLVQNAANFKITDSVLNYNFQDDNTFLYINIGFPGMGGGIVFNNVTGSLVQNNQLNNQDTGIHLFNSSGNTIVGNTASFNHAWGIALFGSSNNTVQHNSTRHDNRCSNGGCDSAGILLVQGSNSNLIEGNDMNYSGDGFFLGNGTAPVPTSNNNTIRNNIADYSPANGYEATFSSGNVFDSNEANYNNYGFWLGYSHDGSIANNIIKRNSTNGIEIDRGRSWQIAGNLLQNNVNGIYLHNNGTYDANWPGTQTSNNYAISNNSFTANSKGLTMQNVQTSSLANNTFTSNGNNLEFDDQSLPVSGVTTTNNNFICGSGSGSLSNVLLNKAASSSIANSLPQKANDGSTTAGLGISYDSSDAWQAYGPVGSWWRADLGSVQTINSFVAYAYVNNYFDMPHQFHFEVSSTGAFSGEQTTVATEAGWDTGSPPNPRYKIYTFAPVSARYVRFVVDVQQQWSQVQEIEAYNDPNIVNDYTPTSFCNYNFYDNLPPSTTTNLQGNYWEYTPKASLAATIYDHTVNVNVGTADYSNPLSARATTTGDSLAPTLAFNTPAPGATLSGVLTTSVVAADNVRVRSVDYYVDNIYLGSSFIAPFSLSFNTVRISNGAHTLRTVTIDNAGNTTTTTIPVTFSNNFVLDLTAPSVPTGLTPTTISPNRLVISWTPATDNVGVTGYYIKRNGSLVSQVSSNSYTDNNVSLGTTYTYSVAAADAADNISSDSAPLSVIAADTQPPTTPANLAANAVSASEIDLTWSAATDNVGVVGYKIYRNGQPVGTSNTTSYKDLNLTYGVTYTYQVAATDAAGNVSSLSNSATATPIDNQPPTVPNSVVAVVFSTTEIDLSWTPSTDNVGVVSYEVFRNGQSLGTVFANLFRDTGLTPATTYTYTVTARDAAANVSSPSAPVSATTSSVVTPPKKIGDLNNDGRVDIYDLSILLSQWNKSGSGDLNNSGRVDIYDLSILLSRWGT